MRRAKNRILSYHVHKQILTGCKMESQAPMFTLELLTLHKQSHQTMQPAVPPKYRRLLDFTAETDTMVCAFGFPGTMEGGLSQAFPVINKTPPQDRGRRAFTSDAPQGLPYEDDQAKPSSLYMVGGMVVLGLCMGFFARVLWQRRKQRKALQTLQVGTEQGGLVDGAKTTRYTDDL